MNVVIRIDEDTKKEMIDYYKDKIKEVDNKPPYVVFNSGFILAMLWLLFVHVM